MHASDISGVDLNLLKIFEALFEEGGASRAAIRLDMTQSAVSAALKRLRVLYDDRLFTPTGRGLAPTARARELKPVVTGALDRVRQSLAIASPHPASFLGRAVAIGLSDDFELALGQPIIAQVARHAPGLRVIFRQTYSQIVSDSLASQDIDLAIAAGGFGARGLSHQSLGQGDYACLVDAATLPREGLTKGLGAGNSESNSALLLEDFVARGHILVSSGGVVGIVDEALAAQGLKRTVIASTTHFAALPHLLKGTGAVATIPRHAASAIAALTGLRLVECPLALPAYPIELGWRANALRDAAVARVRDAIAACSDLLNAPRA
ncbi:DNA-binding transcriptional LysR family regulator [Paraburkholderia bannensis]|uniref:DNA-binding transcriptional LysR family regulator n=1 Tax=Paraburkholderia bannensis TaxID=765414 RepID=A0A7W9WRT6_9BURK|nr:MULTISPECIES: LysR family transcriptional regulator [Paraburkholderia]MBB3256836.1 DNA-binding transcriptional LysR family regulator [Paraburkholderia sp. WP4_3_2]MBB6101834.1 DNA-binding transcriptional LysR family regulator [Paraburkholderia bannensis]